MRLLIGLVAFWSLGCFWAGVGQAVVYAVGGTVAAASKEIEFDPEKQDDVADLMRLSRDELIDQNDEPSAPVCRVDARRTGKDSWELRTCREKLDCHPQGERYSCRSAG